MKMRKMKKIHDAKMEMRRAERGADRNGTVKIKDWCEETVRKQ